MQPRLLLRETAGWKQQDPRWIDDKERPPRAQRTPLPADPSSADELGTDCPEEGHAATYTSCLPSEG